MFRDIITILAFSYKVRVAVAYEASARLSSLVLLIVSLSFHVLTIVHVHLHLTLPVECAYEGLKMMHPQKVKSKFVLLPNTRYTLQCRSI